MKYQERPKLSDMKFPKFSNTEIRKEKIGNKEIRYITDNRTKWPHLNPLSDKIYINKQLINVIDDKTLKAILAHEEYHALSLKPIKLRLIILMSIIFSIIFLVVFIIIVILIFLNAKYQLIYPAILSLAIFCTLFGLYLYFIKYNERAADMYACLLIGKSAVINSLTKLEKLKRSNLFKPPIPKFIYEFTHLKFEKRILFLKNLEDFRGNNKNYK